MCKQREENMTKEKIEGFVDYIEHTLLPDLEASGSEGMVMDWREAVEIIKEQNIEIARKNAQITALSFNYGTTIEILKNLKNNEEQNERKAD